MSVDPSKLLVTVAPMGAETSRADCLQAFRVEHNDQLVQRAVELARIAQRTPMTPDEARDLLQIKRR
jgi:hypothetical protein